MRKHLAVTAVALVLGLALVLPPAVHGQQGEQQERTVDRDLKAVDLDQLKITVVTEGEPEITLVLTSETVVLDPSGGVASVEILRCKEGTALTAKFVEREQGNLAVTIQLLA
jgi:hypothetical protein